MNLLHPIFHTHSQLLGSRIGLDQSLPASLKDEDLAHLIDDLSEPLNWEERLAAVSVTIKNQTLRGRNWTELLARLYGHCAQMYNSITVFVRQTLRNNLRELEMLPFTSLDIEPNALNRVIELDHETGDTIYDHMMKMFARGIVAPVISMPFHPVLPLMRNDFDRRIVVRIALEFYWPILRRYHAFMRKTHKDHLFVTTIQLPEGAFTHDILRMIYEEYKTNCAKHGVRDCHVVFLLDNRQAIFRDNDQLMKSWNVVRVYEDRNEFASVVFRDFGFSFWVQTANPSVKKLIDRTIAKVDAGLNDMGVDYGWSHFDDIEALVLSDKSALNFEQKIVKLIELGYVPVSPDVFVRRKLSKAFGVAAFEPQVIRLHDQTSWAGWDGEHIGFSRWTGWNENEQGVREVDKKRRYTRWVPEGRKRETGSPCWKIAFHLAREKLIGLVLGNPEKLQDGMVGVLAGLVPSKDPKRVRDNVMNFLVAYAYIYWREHFLQQPDIAEADIMLDELANQNLAGECDDDLADKDILIGCIAAQAYYLALDSYRSAATRSENFDQRSMYEAAMALTTALCNAVRVYQWLGRKKEADALVAAIKEELLDFAGAYKRYDLASYGVVRKDWNEAIKSVIPDCEDDIIRRAARRAAARHLLDLGYKEFPEEDQYLSANCGHLWTSEIDVTNYVWDNRLFCGVKEE
ncbi:MAG: hypothetical protein NTX50_00260 [Candidatus Sumerlaeota bacterium]|nr:hypothetical protein [Candidatus Sumerlaeota bacterium]